MLPVGCPTLCLWHKLTKQDTWPALRCLFNVCPPDTPCFGSVLSQPREQLSCVCSESEYHFANIKFNLLMGLQETTRIYTSLKDTPPHFFFSCMRCDVYNLDFSRVSHRSGEGQVTFPPPSLLVRILRGKGQGPTFQSSGFTKGIRIGSQQLRDLSPSPLPGPLRSLPLSHHPFHSKPAGRQMLGGSGFV